MTALDEATRRQLEAARPDASTWLSANAGSGKTRVLTDRVARLLLDGVEPQHILCLTYTKAAASEMQNRLFKRLGAWAMLPDAELAQSLVDLGAGHATAPDALRRARTLFASAIETPGGLKIQTIHSFCAALCDAFRSRRRSARSSPRSRTAPPTCCGPRSWTVWRWGQRPPSCARWPRNSPARISTS